MCFVSYQKQKLENWESHKPEKFEEDMPHNIVLRSVYIISMSSAFEIILNVVIFLNVIAVIAQLVLEFTNCDMPEDQQLVEELVFDCLNYVFIAIYVMEAILKVTVTLFVF